MKLFDLTYLISPWESVYLYEYGSNRDLYNIWSGEWYKCPFKNREVYLIGSEGNDLIIIVI